jgi:hypothetical protein
MITASDLWNFAGGHALCQRAGGRCACGLRDADETGVGLRLARVQRWHKDVTLACATRASNVGRRQRYEGIGISQPGSGPSASGSVHVTMRDAGAQSSRGTGLENLAETPN